MTNPAVALAVAAIDHLCALADPAGGWIDFLVPAGPSNSWVTAYAVCALRSAASNPLLPRSAVTAARAAAETGLDALEHQGHHGGWGWSATTRADADSTAWAVRALLAGGRSVPDLAWAVLAAHSSDSGYRTYRATSRTGRWALPMPEVSAVVEAALAEGAKITASAHARLWERWYFPAEDPHSQWWPTPWHPAALIAACQPRAVATGLGSGQAIGHRPQWDIDRWPAPTSVADLAAFTWLRAVSGEDTGVLVARIGDLRHPLGGWPGDTTVLVPRQQPECLDARTTDTHTTDARGVFTTSTVLQAMTAVLSAAAGGATEVGMSPCRDIPSSASPGSEATNAVGTDSAKLTPAGSTKLTPAGSTKLTPAGSIPLKRDARWDDALAHTCAAQGIDPRQGLALFRAMTRESLGGATTWPSSQLSVLAAGQPVEYSATGRPGVRFTTEVGDPRLPGPARIRSGLAAIGRAATFLGLSQGWEAVRPVVAALTAGADQAPATTRFWVWAGADLASDRPPTLKTYLNLHAGDVAGWRDRCRAALAAGGIPTTGSLRAALEDLDAAGWGHEMGLGIGPHGRWGLKIYYELDRWRPDLLARLLDRCALPATVSDVSPDIPGVIAASAVRPRRSGIALRVDPGTGEVTEVTTAVALPVPLVPRETLNQRMTAWLDTLGQPSGPLRALLAAHEPTWRQSPSGARMLSLVTRSVSRHGSTVTVYVRPGVPGTPASPACSHPASSEPTT